MKRKLFYAFLFCVVAVVVNTLYIKFRGERNSTKKIDEVKPAYTAIVFGAGLRKDTTPSYILRDRLSTAAELYAAGKVKRILLSGDNRTLGYDEPESMKRYLIGIGVPGEDIFLDYAGFDTYSTMYRARDVFKVSDAILVSQQYHINRALHIGGNLGMKVSGYAADKRKYKYAKSYYFRELGSCAKAQLDLLRGREPHFLGPVIDIHGASNAFDKEIAEKNK
jgi:SanA protein